MVCGKPPPIVRFGAVEQPAVVVPPIVDEHKKVIPGTVLAAEVT